MAVLQIGITSVRIKNLHKSLGAYKVCRIIVFQAESTFRIVDSLYSLFNFYNEKRNKFGKSKAYQTYKDKIK